MKPVFASLYKNPRKDFLHILKKWHSTEGNGEEQGIWSLMSSKTKANGKIILPGNVKSNDHIACAIIGYLPK